jgi:hypothetical protein
MRRTVSLRICPLWSVDAAELLRRAKERDFQARQLRADRAAEDHFVSGVARRVAVREARKAIRFVNQLPAFLRRQAQ